MSVIVLEKAHEEHCSVLGSKTFKPSLYFINYNSSTNLSNLRRCLANSWSPEVVAISLSDSSVMELSSVYTPPRHFTRSSVAEVIQHRVDLKTPDFGGGTITAASMNYTPFTFYTSKNNKDTFYGTDIALFDELARHLNFTLRYDKYTNWGYTLDNGSWGSGIGRAMQDNRDDVAIAHIWQIPSLYKVMDFGPSINLLKLRFIVRRPETIDFNVKVFIKVFKPKVWFAVIVSLLLVVIVYRTLTNKSAYPHPENWFGSFLTVFGHFTMSTSHTREGNNSTRHIMTCWSLFSLLLTSCLSSGIISRLTLPLYSPRVDTLQQLVEQNYYWTVQYYVRFTTDEMRRTFFNFEEHWSSAFEKKYVYILPENVSEKAGSDKKIAFLIQMDGDYFPVVNVLGLMGHKALGMFRIVKQTVGECHATFGVRKNSPLLEPLTIRTLRFLETGLPRRWQTEITRRWPVFDSRHLMVELDLPTSDEPQPLHLYKMKPIFFLLLLGLSIACAVFFVELSW